MSKKAIYKQKEMEIYKAKGKITSTKMDFESPISEKPTPINLVVEVESEGISQDLVFCVANSIESEDEYFQFLDLGELLGTLLHKEFIDKELELIVCTNSFVADKYIYAYGVDDKFIIPLINLKKVAEDINFELKSYYSEEEVKEIIKKVEN